MIARSFRFGKNWVYPPVFLVRVNMLCGLSGLRDLEIALFAKSA
jgi:hypothetical protein